MDISDFEFNLFYSVYSFPNIIIPIFGGYLVDVIGQRIGNILFAVLITIGQGIFAFGVMINNYPVALIGRAVFGTGGESLNVSTNMFMTNWFSGKELAMAIGVTVSVSRLGSVTNDNTEPVIVIESGSLSLGLWIGFAICVFSMSCAMLLNYLDHKKDLRQGITERIKLPPSEKFRFSDMKDFGFIFWCICVNCFVVYIDISCFNNIASNYFQERFGYNSIEAGSIISITYIVAALLCPFFGIIVDKIGQRVYFIAFSAFIVTLVHIAFLLTPETNRPIYPIFYMVFLGLGYSIYASVIWASIPYIVQAKVTGTAFGTATAIQNLGLACGPIIVGMVQENTHKDRGYYWVSFFFIMVGLIGIASSIIIYIYDKQTGGILQSKNPVYLIKQSMAGKDSLVSLTDHSVNI